MKQSDNIKGEFAGLVPERIVVSEEAFTKLQTRLNEPTKLKPELVKLLQTDFSHLFS